jgi:hypothetical protein
VVDQTNQKQRTMQALADAAGALAANGCGRRHRTVSKITADLPDDPADRIDEVVGRLAEIQSAKSPVACHTSRQSGRCGVVPLWR